MRYPFSILLIFALSFTACGQSYDSFNQLKEEIISHTIPLITVDALKKESSKSIVILDAREKEEYQVSHLKNAKYVGYDHFKMSSLKGIDKASYIVIYCSVGYRSEKIGEQLKKAGFTHVVNLQGGIFDWVNAGYPVYNNNGNKTPKVHAYSISWGKWLTKGDKVYE